MRHLPVVTLVQANRDREETRGGVIHVTELPDIVAQARDGTAEGREQEQHRNEEASDLRHHVTADEDEGCHLRGEDRHVDQQHPVNGHGRHGEDRVPELHYHRPGADLRGPLLAGAYAVEHGLVRAHQHDEDHEHEAELGKAILQVFGHRYSPDPIYAPPAVRGEAVFCVEDAQASQAEDIVHRPSGADRYADSPVLLRVCLREDGLAQHEDKEAEEEAKLGEHEQSPDNARPQRVGHEGHHWMRNHRVIRRVRDRLQRARDVALAVDDNVLHVVVHAPHAVLGAA
mmetsp:Transcript_38389/g.99184  ORF Transcript_38389/g.99184 Transcript_38389/m.99184 type:complete len:286 (+) Transcript_38389:410-1267(+)